MPARREAPRLTSGLAAGLAVAALVGSVAHTRPVRLLELKTRDVRMRATIPHPGGHPDVTLVIVTEETIDWMHETKGMAWPWPRDGFGYLFHALALGKAAVVLFDFFTLNDPGESEPEIIEAMKSSPPAFLAVPFVPEESRRRLTRLDYDTLLERYAIRVESDGSIQVPDEYRWADLPRPGIAEAARGICDVATPRDADGVLRRYRLFSRLRGRFYPSFALAALMVRENADRVAVRDRVMTVGRFSIPLEADGTLPLRYYEPGEGFRFLPASRVIGGWEDLLRPEAKVTTFNPKDVGGKIVIVGTNAPALYDLKITPVSEGQVGCEIHAVALANILNGTFLRETPRAVSLALVALLSLLIAVVTRFTSAAPGGVLAVAVLGGYAGLSVGLLEAGWIVDLAPQGAAGVLAYAAASALNFLFEGRQRRRVKREFSRYHSPAVVEKILRNPDGLSLAGERKPLTLFFMDFAGFTAMSETMDPSDLVKLISAYHHEAAQEIWRNEGTIDKFIGDAIMAFWNDPFEQVDHALRACLAAVGAQRRLRDLARRMRERGLPEMRARIGINTGVAVVGDIGALGQVNYTAIGDEVNLASRLEGVNKEFGTEILVSEPSYRTARERLEARELALIKVKGRRQPVRIYEILGLRGEIPEDRLRAVREFQRGLAAFQGRRFEEALAIFQPLAARGDPAAGPYADLSTRHLLAPPGPDWDGSYEMRTK